jgi:hypothetical protein
MSVESDITKSIRGILAEPDRIGTFGTSKEANNRSESIMRKWQKAFAKITASSLARTLTILVARLHETRIERLNNRGTLLDRYTGRHFDRQIRYQEGQKEIAALLKRANEEASDLRASRDSMQQLIVEMERENVEIEAHVNAGHEFLASGYDPMLEVGSPTTVRSGLSQLERRLTHLAALLTSNKLTIAQSKLAIENVSTLLVQFDETSRVLVPIWQQHVMCALMSNAISPELTTQVRTAQDALAKALKGMLVHAPLH